MTAVYRRVVPSRIRSIIWQARRRWGKPRLKYLETHLTDHCVLNCRGCGHFAPLASPWFASIAQHERDMKQLAHHFANVDRIRLMGGEPLLHPEVKSFLSCTRRWFPRSNIRLVTNGILLKGMSHDFWQCCRDNKIGIDVTIYPPTAKMSESVVHMVKNNGLEIVVTNVTQFWAHRNLKGDSDPDRAMTECRKKFYCPYLLEGRLYICALPALGHYFNDKFGTNIPHTGFVDIHSAGLTGRKIIRLLERPADACRFCSYDVRRYEWSVSKGLVQEWDAFDTSQPGGATLPCQEI